MQQISISLETAPGLPALNEIGLARQASQSNPKSVSKIPILIIIINEQSSGGVQVIIQC